MKITIDKSDLQNALQKLTKISPTRTTLPILNSILLQTGNNFVELRGTDLEISMKIKVPANITKDGVLAIPLKKLTDITNEIPEGDINIKLTENNQIELTNEFGKYTLMGNVPEEFPSWSDIGDSEKLTIDSDILDKIITNTIYAVSKDEIKPALQGVLFHTEKDTLRVVSTDGAKLVKVSYKKPGNTIDGNVIIPTKFLSVLRNHLDTDLINIMIGKNHVMVSTEQIDLSTRIINQKYPDYESVIPTENDKNVTIEKSSLLAAVRRVSIFSNRSTNQISLQFNNNLATVFTQDPENVSTGTETVNCSYSGEEFTIGFNAEFLKETLSHIEEGEVELSMKSPISASIFKNVGDEKKIDMISLLMPIRIGD